nr:hypothetical protein [Finegoldia magna]
MVKYTNTKAKRSKECRQKKINFVHGQGIRKHQLQRDYEQLKDWKSKLKSYPNKLDKIVADGDTKAKITMYS